MTMPCDPLPLRWRRRLVVLWGALIAAVVFLSLHPRLGPPSAAFFDKWTHLVGYGVLAGLPFLAFRNRRAALIGALAMLPLGIALEIAQDWVPGRSADVLDLVANTLGVAVGVMLGPWASRHVSAFMARRSAKSRP